MKRSMPICLRTATLKSSGIFSSKRFELECSSSVVVSTTEEEHSRSKRLEENIPELAVYCTKASGH